MEERKGWYCTFDDLKFMWAVHDEYTQDQYDKGEIPGSSVGDEYIRKPENEKEWKEAVLNASNDGVEWFPIPSMADANAEGICPNCISKIEKELSLQNQSDKKARK